MCVLKSEFSIKGKRVKNRKVPFMSLNSWATAHYWDKPGSEPMLALTCVAPLA